ncbi:hypothetical protein VTN77DRAFT_2801 [Rasamsonia byssochlamydoides]|uniref:uncharacterized protein n=1 Tax=Rasamsonia byssochlamydoides TaxID=89139 RepID=UPI003743AC80
MPSAKGSESSPTDGNELSFLSHAEKALTDPGKQANETSGRDSQNEAAEAGEAAEAAEDEDHHYNASNLQLAMLTLGLCLCTLIVSLDVIILATAIPKITATFHSLDDVGWYGSSYLLTQTALQPSFGMIYNYFDTKWTFLCGILVFEVGSVLCAAANSSNMLIVGRAVAGVGAAALFSGGMNIIAMSVALKRRAPYIALLSSMLGISNVAGPPLGGVLTDRLGWRWCFWINLPCGGVAFGIVLLFLKRRTGNATPQMGLKERLAALDPLGGILLLAGITTFLLGIAWGGTMYAWSDAKVWGCILASGLIMTMFCVTQWKRGDRATIPSRLLLKQRTMLGSSLFSCFLSMGFYVHVYYLPIYFQAVKGSTPGQSGLDLIPYQISNTAASLGVSILVGILGWYVPFVWLGAIAFIVGSGLLYTLKVNSSAATLIGYQIVAGAGLGGSVQIPYIAAQVVSSKRDMSSANAIMIFFHSIGGTIGLAIGQNIFLSTLKRVLPLDAPLVNATALIAAGPTNLRSFTPPEQLAGVLEAYNTSIVKAFISSIATGLVAFLFSLLMEWKSVKGIDMLTGERRE